MELFLNSNKLYKKTMVDCMLPQLSGKKMAWYLFGILLVQLEFLREVGAFICENNTQNVCKWHPHFLM